MNPTNQNNGGPLSPEEKQRHKSFQFFGYEIIDKEDGPENSKVVSFTPPLEENESSIITAAGSVFGHSIDVRGDHFVNDRDLIVKYRNASMHPEVDRAIEEIINEMVVANDTDQPVTLNLDYLEDELDKTVRKAIIDEFDHVLNLLDFRKYGQDIIRRWYIDGRIAYHNVIDLNNPKRGIIEMRPINPLKIQRIKEVVEDQDPRTGAKLVAGYDEYFIYSEDGFTASSGGLTGNTGNTQALQGLKVAKDAITYVTSGQLDPTRRFTLSYLHKSLRSINQLRMMEDALVIYRLSRAPERRIFYVDVGDLPPAQAQNYLARIQAKYRNRISYDPNTGGVKSDRNHMHMLEDFWLPRSSAGRGTEVTTLPGGQNLGEIDDILFMKRAMLQSMNVPYSRMDTVEGSSPFTIGRSNEIDRDEIRFQKFIDSMRIKFSDLFRQALRSHLILKNIVKENEWDQIKDKIIFDFARDNFFSELKEAEILRERIDTLNAAADHIGTYFSKDYVRRKILRQTEEDIRQIKQEIRAEALTNDGLPNAEADGVEGFGGPGGAGGAAGAEGGFEGDLGGPDFGMEGETGMDEVPLGEPEGAATELGPDEAPEEELPEEEPEDNEEEPRRI